MSANRSLLGRTKAVHTGPHVLPTFTLLNRLLRLACKETKIAFRDAPQDIAATHLQLITYVLNIRNHLLSSLGASTRAYLANQEEVYITLLGPGGYEYVAAFLAIVAAGGIVVPICEEHDFNLPLEFVFTERMLI